MNDPQLAATQEIKTHKRHKILALRSGFVAIAVSLVIGFGTSEALQAREFLSMNVDTEELVIIDSTGFLGLGQPEQPQSQPARDTAAAGAPGASVGAVRVSGMPTLG